MRSYRLCKTKETYKQPGGLEGVVLDTLKTFPNLRVVAVKRDLIGWRIMVIADKDLEYTDE